MRKRITFAYMGSYWSMPNSNFKAITQFIEDNDYIGDLSEWGAKILKCRPHKLDRDRLMERSTRLL